MKRLTVFVFLLLSAVVPASAAPAPAVFKVPGIDAMTDFHGDPAGADLVIFASGNKWFAMPKVLAALGRAYPDVHHIFYETLPPGVLAEQMRAGAIRVGEFTLRVQPDVFMSGKKRMNAEINEDVVDPPVIFASNVLSIIVKSGNPKHIESLSDLKGSDVRAAMPNPATEGIARQIILAYKKAGGDAQRAHRFSAEQISAAAQQMLGLIDKITETANALIDDSRDSLDVGRPADATRVRERIIGDQPRSMRR